MSFSYIILSKSIFLIDSHRIYFVLFDLFIWKGSNLKFINKNKLNEWKNKNFSKLLKIISVFVCFFHYCVESKHCLRHRSHRLSKSHRNNLLVFDKTRLASSAKTISYIFSIWCKNNKNFYIYYRKKNKLLV